VGKRYLVETFGCQMNVHDSERLSGLLEGVGYQPTEDLERADLLIGFSTKFPTHVIEVERADSWSEGLRQALWYQAAIFKAERRHVLPLLLLFGNTTAERFEQVLATCDHNHVTLCTHRLELDGRPEVEHSLGALLNGPLHG